METDSSLSAQSSKNSSLILQKYSSFYLLKVVAISGGVEGIYDEPNKPLKTATFGRKECDVMAKPNLGEKDILNPSEAIEYFVLSRRKFYDLLKNTDGEDFLAYYGERKLIIRVAFEKYLLHHPELRRQV